MGGGEQRIDTRKGHLLSNGCLSLDTRSICAFLGLFEAKTV